MVKISVLIPVHNEEGNLPELVKRIDAVMKNCCGKNWELLLIDDNSSDKSLKIMDNLAKKNENIRTFHHEENRGQTGCFKTGFDNAKGEYVITMDGDLQVYPEDIPLFIDKISRGYEFVNAIRENRQHSFWMIFASRVYNILMLLFFNSPVMDNASNYAAIKTKFVKNLPLIDNDHRYLAPITMRRGLKKFGEVIIRHEIRKKGKSSYKALPKYLKGFPEIFVAWMRIKRGRYDVR